MKEYINPKYPDIPYLRKRAKKRIPGFAFDYLDGGCNAEVNLRRNTDKIRETLLSAAYVKQELIKADTSVEILGQRYSVPFGIAPIGLQGLMWPQASEILAKAAFDHNLPFVLSTVATASIEKIGEITEGKAWFQLYHPVEDKLRDDLLKRAEEAEYPVLVVLSDTPTFGYRSKEIRNGLSIPPRMTLRNMLQIMSRPAWALNTLLAGQPEFKTLKPYIPKGMSLKHLGLFMDKTFDGRMSEDRLKAIRDKWKGKLVLKGVSTVEDVNKCVDIGLDGVIVSNHGGRQLDHGPATIETLPAIVETYHDQIKIMMDSGIKTGPDIASTLAKGADFAFLGRSFMYGVAALGTKGGDHTISVLKRQFEQVLNQLRCETVSELKQRLF